MKEEVLSSNEIWLCLTCYQCQERCPQKVRVTDIIFDCKNLATEAGKVPPTVVAIAKDILTKGQLYTVTADWEVPGLSVDAVKTILKGTRTSRLVGGDE